MNERTNLVCVATLGVVCVVALVGWVVLEAMDRTPPAGLYVIVGTALGSLTTFLQRAGLNVTEFQPEKPEKR